MITFKLSAPNDQNGLFLSYYHPSDYSEKKLKKNNRKEMIQKLVKQPIEQMYESDQVLRKCTDANQLMQAIHDCYYGHFPLIISPDMIWFTLAQGLCNHVNLNAEELRERFVKHQGQLKLEIVKEDFVLGQDNDWESLISEFSDKIAGHVGKTRDLIVNDFSTTGPIERFSSEILVMDTFQAYFEYYAFMGCGIPSITLLGTTEDWKSIYNRIMLFAEWGLEDWTDSLKPILNEFVEASKGNIDKQFWESIFHDRRGGYIEHSAINGWAQVLFPYILNNDDNNLHKNPYMSQWKELWNKKTENIQGLTMGNIPSSLASAPITTEHIITHEITKLRIIGGMFGIIQDEETKALFPEFGWVVVHGHETGDKGGLIW